MSMEDTAYQVLMAAVKTAVDSVGGVDRYGCNAVEPDMQKQSNPFVYIDFDFQKYTKPELGAGPLRKIEGAVNIAIYEKRGDGTIKTRGLLAALRENLVGKSLPPLEVTEGTSFNPVSLPQWHPTGMRYRFWYYGSA